MQESTKTRSSSGGQCSCISTGRVTATFDSRKPIRGRVLADGKARPHRWAPEAGYVTFLVNDREDLEPAVDLIRMSHRYFAGKPNVEQTESQQ